MGLSCYLNLRDTHDSLLSCLARTPPRRKDIKNEKYVIPGLKYTFTCHFMLAWFKKNIYEQLHCHEICRRYGGKGVKS